MKALLLINEILDKKQFMIFFREEEGYSLFPNWYNVKQLKIVKQGLKMQSFSAIFAASLDHHHISGR